MKTLQKLMYVILIAVIAAFVSCKGETGPAGPAGADGVDGINGVDGNANVQTYVYNNPSWDLSGSALDIDMADILTDDILENDVLLSYVKHTGLDMVAAIPGTVWTGSSGYRNYPVFFGNSTSTDPGIFTFRIVSLEMDGTFTPHANLKPIDWIKIIIIESTNTTTNDGNKNINPQQEILYKLDKAGVDVNNYYQVCAYFDIEP